MDKLNYIYDISKYFKPNHAGVLESINQKDLNEIEEIRIRAEKSVVVHKSFGGKFLCLDGTLSCKNTQCLCLSFDEIDDLIAAFCQQSVFAHDKELKQGFLTIKGGFRIGISGKGIYKNDALYSLRDFSGINIRIPRELIGISKKLIPYIFYDGVFLNTLIVSPPNLGKTTLLRDITRCIGDGDSVKRIKSVIIDERSEIACINRGKPIYNVGEWTDVVDGIEKSVGIFMALRSLSPEVVITDEIGQKKDLDAVFELVNSGVKMIASTHAYSIEDIKNRCFFKKLLDERVVKRFVFLSDSLGKGTVKAIYDENLKQILNRPFLLTYD